MRFLLKLAFWLGVVILLLPMPSQSTTPGVSVGASDAMSAAGAAIADLRQFCSRQPEACAVGSQVLGEAGLKAQAGAKMLYEFLTEKFGQEAGRQPAADPASGKPVLPAAAPSQNTLTPGDLAPGWRGQPPRKEPDPKRSA
jgi:hypothetical protein